LNLKCRPEWQEYCKSGCKPADIPANPHATYKNEGWISYGDWLGTGRIANQNKIYTTFVEAREFVHKLNLKSQRQYFNYCKNSNKPDNIPRAPHKSYKNKGWISWPDWLGTNKVQGKEND
jgi:hypothetical protein